MSSRSSLPVDSGLGPVESGVVTGSPDCLHALHLASLTAPGTPHSPFKPGSWATNPRRCPPLLHPLGRQGGIHTQEIAGRAEAGDLYDGGGSNDRVAPELVAGVDVGEVDFDDGDLDRGDRIPDGDGVVAECPRIDDDRPEPLGGRGLDPVDQVTLMVGLATYHGGVPQGRMLLDLLI